MALGKEFVECVALFAECYSHSVNTQYPVVYGVEMTCIGLTSHGTTVSVRKGQADVVKSLLQIVRFDLISNESKLD